MRKQLQMRKLRHKSHEPKHHEIPKSIREEIRNLVIRQLMDVLRDSSKGQKHRLECLTLILQIPGGLDRKSFDLARILIAAAERGPKADKIAARTGLDCDLIKNVEPRMRESGLWVGAIVKFEHWFEGDCLDLFFEDLAVAQGLSVRTEEENQIFYRPKGSSDNRYLPSNEVSR